MTQQAWLFALWFGGFVVGLALVFAYWSAGFILEEQVNGTLLKVIGIYAPYLTPILAFWYAKPPGKDKPAPSFLVAVACSLLFLLVITGILGSVFFRPAGEGVVESALELAAGAAMGMAFLVGPAIGFFFGKAR